MSPPDPTRSAAESPPATRSAHSTPATGRSTAAGMEAWLGVAADPEPDRVAGYVVECKLGQGGMGVVFKGVHPELKRTAAIKQLLSGRHAGERERVRFLAEAEAMAAVSHPHVVGVYDFGTAGGQPFLAMEYLPGGSLHARLEAEGKLPTAAAVGLVEKVAAGVQAAHEQGIVHRDLKPGNVLLDAAGEPKVTDFGLAKRGDHDTASHAVMGTASYMAPEQASGRAKTAGPAADVYALGAILFRCLAGRPPFDGDDWAGVLVRVVAEDAPSVSSVNAAVPRDLALIVAKCLEKEPARRYPTAAALAADLRRFRAGEPVSVRPAGGGERLVRWVRRRPYLAGLAGALAASLVIGSVASAALAVWALGEKRRANEQADAALASKRAADAAADLAEARKRDAEAEAARANQVTDALAAVFRTSDPIAIFTQGVAPPSWETERRRTAEELLKGAADRFRTALRDQPLARGRLLGTAGVSLRNLGLIADARPLLAESLKLRQQHLPGDSREVADAEMELGRLDLEAGDYPAALELCRAGVARHRRAGTDERAVLDARLVEGFALGLLGRDEAATVLRGVVADRDRLDGPTHQDALIARLSLATVLLELHRPEEAAAVVPGIVSAVTAQPPGQVRTLGEIVLQFQAGFLLAHQSDQSPVLRQAEAQMAAADAALAVAMPARTIYRAIIRFERATVCHRLGRTDECDAHLAECLADIRATCGLAHPKAFVAVRGMAQRLAARDRWAEARALYAEAEVATVKRYGAGSPMHALLLLDVTEAEAEHRQYPAAVAAARRALAAADRLPPTRSAWVNAREAAAELRDGPTGLVAEPALALLRLGRRLAAAADGPAGRGVFVCLRDEADLLRRAGRHAEAATETAECERLLGNLPKLSALDRNLFLVYRGRLAADRGDFAAAERSYRAAADLSRGLTGKHASYQAEDLRDLAGALADQGKLPAAKAALERAVAAAKGQKPPLQADVRGRLAAVKLALGDEAGYRAEVAELLKRFGDSADRAVLATLVAAGARRPDSAWDLDGLRRRLAAAGGRDKPTPKKSSDPGYPLFDTDWLDRLPVTAAAGGS